MVGRLCFQRIRPSVQRGGGEEGGGIKKFENAHNVMGGQKSALKYLGTILPLTSLGVLGWGGVCGGVFFVGGCGGGGEGLGSLVLSLSSTSATKGGGPMAVKLGNPPTLVPHVLDNWTKL